VQIFISVHFFISALIFTCSFFNNQVINFSLELGHGTRFGRSSGLTGTCKQAANSRWFARQAQNGGQQGLGRRGATCN
jgi:hypothetical protein